MSFYSDYEKKKNKNKTSALLKVPQVVPQKPAKQDNSRRATAAHNREQQRVQAHQNAQRPASTYLTGGSTTRSQPYAANQQRNTVFQQRGNTRQGLSGTGSRSTQQNNLRQPASTYLTGGSVTRSQPYAASQQNQLFSARKAAEQRRNPRQNVSTATKSSGDGNPTLTQFLKNSMDWHKTSDPNRKAQLHAQNDALRRKLGYEYNPQTGASFDKYGHEMTAGVRMAYGSKPTERLNQATQLLHTSGVMGKTDKATVYPTAMQAAQGLDEDYFSGQTGYNAHKTMYDLFNRSDETWSSEDTQSRDRARQELSIEMSRIMKRYGLTYQPRDNADDIINRLKAAGADENTLAYVQENIDLRHAADRLGNSMEAVGKRWIASLPSLVDTSRQVSANVEESRQNEEYRQLEEQEQTLELTLQGMNSTAADGSVPADYQAVYDQLQEVRKRKNELTVNKGVDPNKWSQRMLREANEAQANAEAGLSPAPRWLTEQGISLAGNAPVMAASAIPVVGPAVGSIMMGGQAAGQRSFELNERGIGARESLTRGLTSGAIEAATERLPLGQMSKILHSGGVNAVKNILIQMGEEATEESASYFLNYVADLAANDPDAKFSLQELAQSAAGGAFGGLVFGTAGAVGSRGVYGSPTENQLTNRPMTEYEAHADTPYLQVERFTEPLTQTMVKIDEQMRKADTLPEGTIKQQYTAALQEDAQRVSRQLSILENNRAELMQARNIAERFGAKFELADLGPAGGKYENGTITVNPYSSSPVRQVLVHELTHHLENSGSYNALQKMALHLFTQEQGVSADVLRDNITRMYAEQGVTLDTQAANRELTAAFCEKRLFQDDASIQRLAQTDVSLFQRIRQWIADTVIRLRGTKEQQQLLELQRRYEKAARTVGTVQDRGAQYKIETLPDGKQYVKSDRQVIEGDDASAWSKQAEQFINEKIRNNADLRVFTKDGFAIDITERSAYKLSDPHVQSIEKVARPMLDREALKAKMQAAGHIDELAETARWSKFAPDRNGKHAYDIGEDGFDTFTTYFEDSDGQYYRVRFTAGVNEDMDTAYSIGLMDKRNHPSSAGSSSAPFGRGAQNTRMVYDNSITPDGVNDNTSGTKFKGLALQREYRQAVESGNMERAREILAEKAARRGYLSYDTTADAQNHIIQNANPVEDDYHTWIRNAGDVHSFAEVLNDSDWNGMDFDPDYTWDMAQKALQTGEITVYSSYPIGTLGGFVTPSRMEAEGYAGNGEVYSKTVNLDDIAWIDPTQGQYAPTQNGGIYKQGSPYAKIPDVTYDDNGKLIPLSQRYDDSRTDSRYTLGFTPEQIAKGTVPLSEAMQYGKTPEQAVMEAKVKKESNAKRAARELYRNIVSGQAEIERFAQMQKKMNPDAPDANDLAQINRVAGSTVDTIAEKALVDRKGDAIGKGWLETVGGLSKEQLEELNLYRLHKHNVDRMSIQGKVSGELGQVRKQYETFLKENPEYTTRSEETIREIAQFGEPEQQIRAKTYLELKAEMNRLQQIRNKPVLARKDKNAAQDKPYTAAESEKILREMDEKNPQLAEWTAQAEGFHDAFMREWVVGSGLMSEEQYEQLKTYYPHYVQTYRAPDRWGGGTDTTRRGSVNTGSPTKQAIGSLKEIIPFEDAEMMQVNSLVKNARRNELFRNIYEFAQAHPEEAASYVRIINTDEDMNTQPLSFDNLTGDMAEAAMSDQGGIYTIRALKDGKPITMQVNSAFYAGLQNLFGQDRGASDTFMKKTFGTMTNAFKVFTTGKNPLFFLTNLPKDFQTAYINTTSSRKTLLTWLADVGATVKHMAANDADWQAFQALGGAGGGFYHNEKGFSRSAEDAGKHQIIKKIWAPIDAVSENTEALWRFNEYRAAVQRYGDTEAGRAKAIQAAADVTTNFSRTAPATKAAENYCAYLNASVQGLDKIARQVKEHPILTARRAAEIIALPTLLLYLINKDDDDYKNLNNRTKDNYYCIPIGDGDFLKIPKSREYGVAMGALLERFFRLAEGEEAESAFKGIGEQFMTNLAPSNPVTDNILKTVFIDLPTNRDFAGRSIVPERMEGLSPENQYDYTTSGAGMAIAKGWNATLGRVAGKISPIQADYLIDSNLGFVGDAIIGATTDPKSPAELAKEMQENPVKTVLLPVFNTVKQKFTANPLYQSGVTDAFYDELDAAQRAANDKNLTENLDADIVTPEETYYSALNKSSSEISELRKQERTILADKSLSAEEQKEKVRDIRRQIIEIAKNAKEKAQEEREEYKKTYVPELSPLSEERQKDGREAMQHGLSAKQFVKWDSRFSDLKNKKDEDGKHIYSEAESRGRVLEEVMADDTLRSGEKQALADYVLISTMGDNDKEKWNDEVKGKVNASDYVRFKSDVAAYEKEYKGTDTDNAANVKRIIDGYENLNAEQKSVLMSVYSDNASKNLYHVSTYEQQIDKNGSFYKGLSQSGRDNLRSMLNEYESAVNDGKALDKWKAKAYMAEKEVDISPATYAMFYIASQKAKGDKSNVSQEAAEAAVNAMDGLTQHQKAYLYQSVNASWKKNPFGSATVGKYESGAETGINPVEGSTVSSPFGPRQTFTTANGATSSKNHHSIDLAAAAGTPIKAFQSGKVTANGWVSGYGWTIEVTHPNGLISQYHHMQNSSSVAVGTKVKQGQTIGNVGSTGNSTGPHLDLSIIKDGKYIDPASVIPALKDSASGYISTDAASYGALTAAAQSSGKKSSGGSRKSGGSSSGGLKQLKGLSGLKGLGF